jgi:hypothetical protein
VARCCLSPSHTREHVDVEREYQMICLSRLRERERGNTRVCGYQPIADHTHQSVATPCTQHYAAPIRTRASRPSTRSRTAEPWIALLYELLGCSVDAWSCVFVCVRVEGTCVCVGVVGGFLSSYLRLSEDRRQHGENGWWMN